MVLAAVFGSAREMQQSAGLLTTTTSRKVFVAENVDSPIPAYEAIPLVPAYVSSLSVHCAPHACMNRSKRLLPVGRRARFHIDVSLLSSAARSHCFNTPVLCSLLSSSSRSTSKSTCSLFSSLLQA